MDNREMVNHPSHYKKSGQRECIVAMEEDYGPIVTACFCLGNAYKYLYRAGNKIDNPEQQDIDKATWYRDYASRILERNENWGDAISDIRKLYGYVNEALNDG